MLVVLAEKNLQNANDDPENILERCFWHAHYCKFFHDLLRESK